MSYEKPSSISKIKVVVIGDPSVGKTSIAEQYIYHTFSSNQESTIGASFLGKNIDFKDQTVRIEIWDTAGQEKYRSLVPIYYRQAHVILLVYDIANPLSLTSIEQYWIPEIIKNCSSSLVYLIGNKVDLSKKNSFNIPITQNELILQRILNNYSFPHYQISAKTRQGVDDLFNLLIAESIMEKKYDVMVNQIHPKTKDYTRLSLVSYLRENMLKCKGQSY